LINLVLEVKEQLVEEAVRRVLSPAILVSFLESNLYLGGIGVDDDYLPVNGVVH